MTIRVYRFQTVVVVVVVVVVVAGADPAQNLTGFKGVRKKV